MMTPMVVQYLVALCCLKASPEAVEVIVGDFVMDASAEKERDVDVTVTVRAEDGAVTAFKAYEVKREASPLDVSTVEQLCAKLKDMPEVSHRAIVSASGFTAAAVKKAVAHETFLYALVPWTAPIAGQFPAFDGIGPPSEFIRGISNNLLCWTDFEMVLDAAEWPAGFRLYDSTPLFSQDGRTHPKFPDWASYQSAILFHSTSILLQFDPARTVERTFPQEKPSGESRYIAGPAWPHTHTLSLRDDEVFVEFPSGRQELRGVTICGRLQWQRYLPPVEYHLIERIPDRQPFAGAVVAEWLPVAGRLIAMVFSPDSRAFNFQEINLAEKHKNAIKKLKVPIPRA